jgi:hypothetical protein
MEAIMAHLRQIATGKLIRTLATASLLALAIVATPAGSAHAAPIGETTTGGNKTCTDPDGKTVSAGTVWTSTTQNGQVASRYKCNGKTGQWDKMAGPPIVQTGPRAPMGPRVVAR